MQKLGKLWGICPLLTLLSCTVTGYQPLYHMNEPVPMSQESAFRDGTLFEGLFLEISCSANKPKYNYDANKVCLYLEDYFESRGAIIVDEGELYNVKLNIHGSYSSRSEPLHTFLSAITLFTFPSTSENQAIYEVSTVVPRINFTEQKTIGARFKTTFGLGVPLVYGMTNLFREKKINNESSQKLYTMDFTQQISQSVFNAWEVSFLTKEDTQK